MRCVFGKKIGEGLKPENVIDNLIIADKTNAAELKKKCLEFIDEKNVKINKDQYGLEVLSWDLLIEIVNLRRLVVDRGGDFGDFRGWD